MITLSPAEGKMINRLRFFSLLCVVMIHSAVHRQPEALEQISATIYEQAATWHRLFYCCNPLFLLFILSGYLFFRNADDSWSFRKDYLSKLKSRLTGLLTPYLVWCTFYLLFGYVRGGCSGSLSFEMLLNAYWPLSPARHVAAPGFWFIRSLICFSLLSPLYYLVYRYLKHFTLPLCLTLALCNLPLDFCYFNWPLLLGGYLAYSGITLGKIVELLPWKPALGAALLLSILSLFCPTALPGDVREIIKLLALILWGAGLAGLFMRCPLPSFCTPAAGMFLYATHFIICGKIGTRLVRYLPVNLPMLVADMWLTFALGTAVCLTLYAVVKRCPKLAAVLTGGRE